MSVEESAQQGEPAPAESPDARRHAELVAQEWSRSCAVVDLVDASVGDLSPVDEVRLGLYLAQRGVARGRVELERLEAQTRRLRSDLVDGEEQLRALATQAVRARRPRHALPVDGQRPLRPAADARPALVVVTPVSEETQAQLVRMGLARPSRPTDEGESSPLPRGALRRV